MSDSTAKRRRPGSSEQRRRLQAACCQEPGAVQELLELYRPLLLKLAHRNLSKSLRAKLAPSDLVQTTIWKAHQAFEGQAFANVQGFRAWLTKILANETIDAGRRYAQSQRREVSREQSLFHPAAQIWIRRLSASLSRSAAGDSFARQRLEEVYRALETLPPHYRLVLRLRYFEKLTFGAIGIKLQRSADAARVLHNRALARLREILKETKASGEDAE